MKFDILVQTLVNDQPEHVFVQHHGIHANKVGRLLMDVVAEQHERLERGKPIDGADFPGLLPNSVVMSRFFEDGAITTVHVFAIDTNEARPHWEAQEARRKGLN